MKLCTPSRVEISIGRIHVVHVHDHLPTRTHHRNDEAQQPPHNPDACSAVQMKNEYDY